jgi:arylsulfatase A-like enzyme/Flp pilus assembly protein TadD
MKKEQTSTRRTRRTPRKALVVLILIGIASALAASSALWFFRTSGSFELTTDPSQNVLLVTIDTLRADALSAYGGGAKTPNIDRLASHGARFTNTHSQAVVTLVSHTSILSGRYPYQTGVRDNAGYRVSPQMPTLASMLKERGLATGAFIGGYPLTKRFGLTRGFDEYDDHISETTGAIEFSLPERRADVVVSRAVNWITGRGGQQFFAWVHVFDPHAPYDPPEQWKAQYPGNPYLGEVAWTDSALGALFDRLATLPQKTLVVITADHGEGLGEHGETTHGLFAYESTLHVPLIIAEIDPKATSYPKPLVVTAPARHVDIVPTVLDAVGIAPDAQLAGTSLRTQIINPKLINPTISDRPSYFEAMTGFLTRGWAPLRGVIAGGDKYIDLPIPELYQLTKDPTEQRNLAPSDASRVNVLSKTLATFDTALPGQPSAESANVSEQLRSLGYASRGPALAAKKIFTESDDPKRLMDLDRDLHAANDFYTSRRYPEAIGMFERVIARRPDLVDAYRYMAYVYWQMGQPASAISTLEKTLTLGIADQDIRTRLATFYAQTGQPQKAITLLTNLPTDDVEALNALGIAYGQAGKNAEAVQTFQKVLAADATNGIALQNIGTIKLRENKIAEAETWLQKALTADPSLANGYTTLGVIYQRTGRSPQAIEAWRRAVELDGREYDALYNLIVSLADSGNVTDARGYAQQFLATAPPAFYAKELADIRRLLR